MRGNDHLLAALDLGHDHIIPVWQRALDRQLERLTGGHLVNIGIEGVLICNCYLPVSNQLFWYLLNRLIVLVTLLHCWWWSRKRASPNLDLLGAELFDRFQLV